MILYVEKNLYDDEAVKDKIDKIADRAGLTVELIDGKYMSGNGYGQESEANKLCLRYDSDGLSLVGEGQTFRGDYSRMLRRLSVNNLRSELLVKASRIKDKDSPLVIDATAGMGEDSLLLAAAGYRVVMFERNPIIAALLEDTIDRAKAEPQLGEIVTRMEVVCKDSVEALYKMRDNGEYADVVYLDPMFPERQKSALVKKKFQLIHLLEEPCSDEEQMMNAAIAAGPHKIVVKRPLKGPYLSGIKPGFSMSGKAIRYDCIIIN